MPRLRSIRIAVIGVALVAITCAAFSRVRSNAFLNYDDNVYVTANEHVLRGLNSQSLAWACTSFYAANWHPVTWLSHMLDIELFGLDAGRHHLSSLLLHAINTVLLFLLLIRMTGAVWRPAAVAGLFAIHPLHVESVAWIAERKDVLSTLFWLLTLAAWLRWLASKTRARYALVLLAYALGLMTKPMLVTLPYALLLLDYWPLKRGGFPTLWKEKAPLFAMSAMSCVVTVVAQRSGGAIQTLERFTFPERLANALIAYAGYLGKTVWPTSLAVFYPYPHVSLFSWPAAGSAILLAGVTTLVLRFARMTPYLTVGWLWYVGTLFPVIGLVQAGLQSMADRYTYVPLIGVFIAIVWGAAAFAEWSAWSRRVVTAAAFVSFGALFAVTRAQVACWSGNRTLLEHALAVTSNNVIAHNNLAGVLLAEGQLPAAIEQLEEALRLDPGSAMVRYNLADLLIRVGRIHEGIDQYAALRRAEPRSVDLAVRLGQLLTKDNRLPEAIESYQNAVALDPMRAEVRNNLGIALAQANRLPEALEQFRAAVRIKPEFEAARANLRQAEEALRPRPLSHGSGYQNAN